jgi:hypothetical protein
MCYDGTTCTAAGCASSGTGGPPANTTPPPKCPTFDMLFDPAFCRCFVGTEKRSAKGGVAPYCEDSSLAPTVSTGCSCDTSSSTGGTGSSNVHPTGGPRCAYGKRFNGVMCE